MVGEMALAFTSRGQGMAVVLLHPVGLSAAFWPVLAASISNRFRVIAVDLAGHGSAPDAERPGAMRSRVNEVARLIDEEVGSSAVILGVSFGGMISMNLGILRPDLVRGLVLAACPPAIPAASRDAILDRGRAAEAGGMDAVIAPTLERWFSARAPASTVEHVRAHIASLSPSNWAAAWEAVAEHDALSRLQEIKVPTLVIAGERDLATPLAAMETVAKRIAGGRLAVMQDAPHMLHLERPEEFTGLVGTFLAGLAR